MVIKKAFRIGFIMFFGTVWSPLCIWNLMNVQASRTCLNSITAHSLMCFITLNSYPKGILYWKIDKYLCNIKTKVLDISQRRREVSQYCWAIAPNILHYWQKQLAKEDILARTTVRWSWKTFRGSEDSPWCHYCWTEPNIG